MSARDWREPLAIFYKLFEADIPFVIIGGHAVIFHGYVRTTEDFDIVFRRTPATEKALLKVLKSIKACWMSNERDSTTGLERLVPVSGGYLQSQRLMMFTTKLGFLDVYDYVPGFPATPVEELFADSLEHDGLRFVSLEWLRRLKRKAGRLRDLADLEKLPKVGEK